MLLITIAKELESLEQTWRPVVCTIVLMPTLTAFQFLHPRRTLIINYKFQFYIGVATRWYWLQNVRRTWAINKINTGTNHHPLPASTQSHVRYSAKTRLILFALLRGIRDGRCNWTLPPPRPNKQREMNDQCTCSSVDQASRRVAGSKAGNFLSCCWGGGGGSVFLAFQWVTNCRCLYARVCSHCPIPFDSKCVHASLCVWMCNWQREQLQEKDRGWIPYDICLPYPFLLLFFLLSVCSRPTWKCLHKHLTHTLNITHTHGARFDCIRQGIHCCFHESMGECTPTTYGRGCCLHNRVWVNAHQQHTVTDVAVTTEYGWMHTHDVRPWMLPLLKVRMSANPEHTACEFLGDVWWRLKFANSLSLPSIVKKVHTGSKSSQGT